MWTGESLLSLAWIRGQLNCSGLVNAVILVLPKRQASKAWKPGADAITQGILASEAISEVNGYSRGVAGLFGASHAWAPIALSFRLYTLSTQVA